MKNVPLRGPRNLLCQKKPSHCMSKFIELINMWVARVAACVEMPLCLLPRNLTLCGDGANRGGRSASGRCYHSRRLAGLLGTIHDSRKLCGVCVGTRHTAETVSSGNSADRLLEHTSMRSQPRMDRLAVWNAIEKCR